METAMNLMTASFEGNGEEVFAEYTDELAYELESYAHDVEGNPEDVAVKVGDGLRAQWFKGLRYYGFDDEGNKFVVTLVTEEVTDGE